VARRFAGGPARVLQHPLLLLTVVGGILFFAALGRLPLLEPDEGRNAEVAREMLKSGDLITPHFNTLTYLDKPAPYFWLIAASFSLAGVNEWAARLPSALMALGTMLLCQFLARRMFDEAVGFRAGLIFATSPLVIIFSRLVIFDMTLVFFVSVAMVSYWLAMTSVFKRPLVEVLFFGAMGVGAIVKGPVGFLLPLLSIILFHIVSGRFRQLKHLRWGVGTMVFVAVALPWFLAVSLRHPDFPRYAFWNESLQRFAAGTARRGGSIFYYLPVYLGGFSPGACLCFLPALLI
jgi:4-amino-4-deoxy-L-arabinose transferase-like glycosyltransferase